ncbi:AAA family ATPase [Luteolibacter sp. AS25]|uniref:AAA family ATPase n=1 Tax=Luteolibacter sp. AS25 TaxID=3135776 RepID=UPI00398AA214
MPFINGVLAENQEKNEIGKSLAAEPRMTRFLFDPEAIKERLKGRIIGQPQMYGAVGDMLDVVKADFGRDGRPLAVLLFLGSTGVGKTETVRALAESILGSKDKLCRIDMNTLAQEHYAAAITGAPPGYVGSKENHTLFDFEKVAGSYGRPGMVLFDEIEKASQSVARALLNVLDAGVLELSAGTKEVNFENSMIFMTSNEGARELESYRRKFESGWRKWLGRLPAERREKEILQEALRRKFDPEFLNRIDKVVFFEELGDGWIGDLLDVELKELGLRLARHGVTIEVDSAAREFLNAGYDKRYGARDLARRVRAHLEPPLARAMLADAGAKTFSVGVAGSEIVIRNSV